MGEVGSTRPGDSSDLSRTAREGVRAATGSGSCFHAHVREATRALVERFGRPTLGNKKNPFNELLFILLSSRTPPQNYQHTYRSLRRRFRRADDLAEATPEEVAETIERGGLQRKRAYAVTAIARTLKQRFGRVTLAPLSRLGTDEAEQFLTSLPGVSTKTARCVLMYALDRPVFPVDAHCHRVARRLGWVSDRAPLTNRVADELQAGVPEHLRRDLHVGMVVLGRRYCRPTTPLCRECPLVSLCPTAKGGLG